MAWNGVARPRERRDTLRAGALDLRERHGKTRRSRHGTGMARLTVPTWHGFWCGAVPTVPFVENRAIPWQKNKIF